jgi:signal-transduction protein with cAMP-binding, CBS, and nucleotidyltransferase domain
MTNCNYSEHTKIQRKEIQKQIEELQEKLKELEEQEPEMLLLRQGKVDFVDYDGKKYFRIEYTDSFAPAYCWYKRKAETDAMWAIRDVNEYKLLEELYQKEVMKQKEEYPYKKYTPEETAEGLKSAMRQAIDEGIVSPMDKLVDDLMKDPPEFLKFELGKTLEEVCMRWWDDIFSINSSWDSDTSIQDLCDRIFLWLPKEQDSSGTQRMETEIAVDTHNELLRKIKSKIHNKKV